MRDPTLRILLLEPDEQLGATWTAGLREVGHVVTWLRDGEAGLAEALRSPPDVVVTELALPGRSGLQVCRRLRARSTVPIVVASTPVGEAEVLRALKCGADLFVTKPCSLQVLRSRLCRLVRRASGAPLPEGGGPRPQKPIRVGPLELDPAGRSAKLAGRALRLSPAEFRLLCVLAERAGRVLTREQLVGLTHGASDAAFDRSIDAHVCRLRGKLEADPGAPRLLRTVRGAGYLLAMGVGERR